MKGLEMEMRFFQGLSSLDSLYFTKNEAKGYNKSFFNYKQSRYGGPLATFIL